MSKKKYINADVLFCFYKQVDELQHSPDKISKIKARFLKNNVIPTIQNYKVENAEEVRYGKWINDGDCFHCSVCNKAFGFLSEKCVSNICPNCGAKMDKEMTEKE